MNRTGYSFVAAANLFRNYGGLAVYIRYRKAANEIRIKEAGKNHVWYIAPDREIVLVRDTYSNEAFRPNEQFDLCIDLNTFRDQTTNYLGIDYVMTNFTHDGIFDTRRDEVKEEDKQIQVMSDSGGLQLARGVSGMIHPKNLVEFYNRNCDAGMVLDLPLWVKDEKLLKRAARLQKANNNIMIENSRPGLELLNIFHGNSVEERRMYRDIVEDERIPRVAIGGLLMQKPLTAVNTMYGIIEEGSFRYNQYHALGVFVAGYLALLVKMANTGDNPPHITSDSTSHVQASLNMIFMNQVSETHNMSRRLIGTGGGSISNPSMHLICCCPVCSAIKYRDIFSFGHNRFNGFLALHNAIEMSRYTKSLQEACRHLTPKQYNAYVMEQLKNTDNRSDIRMALDFIDVVAQDGLVKAQKKYAHHIGKWKAAEDRPSSLFNEDAEQETASKRKELLKKTLATLETMEKQIK